MTTSPDGSAKPPPPMPRRFARAASRPRIRPTGRSPKPDVRQSSGPRFSSRVLRRGETSHMIERHLMKLRARDAISRDEEQEIRKLMSRVVTVPPDRTVIHAGEELGESTLLLDGWMARAKVLPSGQRQLAELHVA